MKRRWMAAVCIVLLVFALPVSARADMGPKPQIVIQVQNAPDEPYYVDLLVPEEGESRGFDNMGWNHIDRATLDSAMVAAMEENRPDGWCYVMLDGGVKQVPTFFKQPDPDTFVFSYFGTPDTFRIAVCSAEGVAVSEVQKRTQLQQTFTYQFRDHSVKTDALLRNNLRQFLSSLLPTLLIEGVLLVPFGFWDKRNRRVFLGVNIGTQIFLTVVTACCMAGGMILYRYLVFVPLELVIWLIEALIYRRTLQSRRETAHPVWYALCANGLSAAATFFSVRWAFPWI